MAGCGLYSEPAGLGVRRKEGCGGPNCFLSDLEWSETVTVRRPGKCAFVPGSQCAARSEAHHSLDVHAVVVVDVEHLSLVAHEFSGKGQARTRQSALN